MRLYHSSDQIVEKPDLLHSRDFLDFGKGFYLTSMKKQAISYAERFKRRFGEAWINVYELEEIGAGWKSLVLEAYDKEWLDFVASCRAGTDSSDFDIVSGGIADDKVIRTLDRYFKGEISDDTALGLLIYEKPNIQYCIRSQELLDGKLKYIESERI